MRQTMFALLFFLSAVTCGQAQTHAPRAGKGNLEVAAQNAKNPASVSNNPSRAVQQKVAAEYGKLPLSFEANYGQTDPKVKFLSRGPGYQLFLLPHDAVLTLQKPHAPRNSASPGAREDLFQRPDSELAPPAVIRMTLLGAGPSAEVSGFEEMPGRSNYFIGNDPKQWRSNVPNYRQVRYRGVYPGIDIIYHGNQQQLEYDFMVAPGADPRRIVLGMNGAEKIELMAGGDLVLHTSAESVRLRKPVIYQETDGTHKEITGGFVLESKNTIKFRIGKYDTSKPLIIDPVLSYSTFLGGSGGENVINGLLEGGLAVDANGNAYVMGFTNSIDFPVTSGAFQTKCGTDGTCNGGQTKIFIAKLNPAGNVLLYSTYLGGSGTDSPGNFGIGGIAVDSLGNAYLTGATTSIDFPTTAGAFQTTCTSCSNGNGNAFVTELNATGSGLMFSTYLGGSNYDEGEDVKVDSSGVYVTGTAFSADFPITAGVFQPTLGGTGGNVFVTKLNPAGSSLIYSTYIGGRDGESPVRIAVDSSRNAYVIGSTDSANFPTTSSSVQTAATSGGVFKTVNGGTTWAASNSGLTDLAVQALAIDRLSTQTIYAGTFGLGVFKSTNGGSSWTAMNSGLTTLNVLSLAVDPTTTGATQIVYAGTSGGGVFRSANGGQNWTPIPATTGLTGVNIRALTIDAITSGSTQIVYAGAAASGVFKSVNGGSTWTAMNNGLGDLHIQTLIIDPTTSGATEIIYAGTPSGVFKSMNGGSSWAAANVGLTTLSVHTLAIDATSPLILYAGTFGGGVFKSVNGGTNWTAMSNGLTAFRIRVLAIDPTSTQTIYAGSNGGGVFKSIDGANSWVAVNSGLAFSVRALAIDPTATSNVYAGTLLIDAFVTKLDSAGATLGYSTFLGGLGPDFALGLAMDSSGNAYVTGITNSPGFPTTSGAFQPSSGGGSHAFVSKLDPTGATLVYSTFLGGSGTDSGNAIGVDGSGDAWVTGSTNSLDFPTVLPLRSALNSNTCNGSPCLDAFVAELNPAGSSLLFSTYLGGRGDDEALGIALDNVGGVYVTGYTVSPDFPILNPAQSTYGGGSADAFVLKISNTSVSADLAITASASPNPVLAGGLLTFQITITNNGPSAATGVTFYGAGQARQSAVKLKTVTVTPSQGTCDFQPVCSLGTLASGASATLTLVSTSDTPGTFVGTGAVGGNESDPTPANNTTTVNVTVNPSIDLRINGTDSPSPVLVNTNLIYTLVVQNNGQIPATGVTLTDTLPPGVTFVSATASQGTPCTGTATITCVLGGLAINAPATVTIVATPTAIGTITNNLIVAANEPSPIPANNLFHQLTDVVAAPNANNARLNGSYAFLFNGFDTSGMMAVAGSFVADGAGNLIGGIADINKVSGVNTNVPFTGTYNIGLDNRGTLTLNFGAVLGTAPLRVALGLLNAQGVATKGRMLGFDSSGSQGTGVIEMQDTTAFSTAAIGGSFAFGASGADSTGQRFGAAGAFHLDGGGNLTLGLEDTDTAGILQTSLGFAGTYSVAANGRGTSTLTFAGSPTPSNYAFYVVSAKELLSISTDPRSATSVLSSSHVLKQVGTFSDSSLNAASVFNATGLQTGGTSDVSVGLFTADGAGKATLLSDENNGGTVSLNQMGSLTYSVAPGGRTTIAGGGGHAPVLYLVDLNRGFLVGTDNTTITGSFEPQAGGPFTNAFISGNYFFGDLERPASGGSNSSGVATSDGAGNITAIQDQNKAGQLVADELFAVTYAVSPNGRTVLLGQGATDASVLYVISPSQAVIMNVGAGNSNGAITIVEGSFIGSVDLAITETSAPNPVLQGATLTYSMTVTNNGPSGATGVTVTDTLPTGLTFVSASASQGICSGPAPVICSLGAIANGASATVSIVVAPTTAGSITNNSSVIGNEIDPNPANNLASLITTVIPTGATFVLTATDIGTGDGTVTDNFALIKCGTTAGVQSGTCSASYPAGATVTLTATPTSPTTFAAWGGACAGTGSCVVSMTSSQAVTASFTPPPQQINVTFNSGSNVSGMATYDCPSNPAPSPANPCTDPNAHALALAIPQVLQPFTLTVQASEIPPSVADGICPNGATPSTDFDCRFTSFFSFQTLTNGDQVVPLCYPLANGNCVHYQVFSGTPGVEPNPAFYVGPIDWNITWNNDTFVPPAPYTGSTPRLYDDPDYAVSPTSPFGTDCTTPMLVGNPPAATNPPIFCQFEFDITTSFNPTKKVDAGITGRTRQFSDVVVAFPLANVGNLTVTEAPLTTPVIAGNAIGFTITVSDSPGGAVTGATLTDALPSGTNVNWTVSPAYAGPGACAISGALGSQVLRCAFGTISASQTFTIGLLSPSSSIGTFTDTATTVVGAQQILSIGTLTAQGIAPTFSGLTPSQSITAGTASINLAGTIGNGTNFIPAGEPITITINGVALSTSTGSNGSFNTTFSTANILSSTTPYTISYSYAGDATFTSVTDASTTLTVNPVVVAQSTLTVTEIGTGNGTVTDNFQLINCTTTAGVQSGTCSANYTTGTSVTLVATPGSPSTFAGWSGACTGTAGCSVTLTTSQSVTASFAPPPQVIPVTFNPGTSVSGMATYNCPSNPAPGPGNPCADTNAHAMALTIGQVLQPITLTVQATEVPPSVSDGICPNGATPSTDFDCRFTTFFTFQTLANGDKVVPLCYPYANGNCVHYQVFSGTPGVEPDPTFYVGPVDWYIGWNNDKFSPPPPYTGSTPRLYDDPDYAVSSTSPYGTNCSQAMLVGNPPAPTNPPVFCQFEFDITTAFFPLKPVDAGITGRTRQFSDVVVAFPPATVGNLTVTEAPLATPVAPGSPIGFTITITNSPGGPVTGATLTDALPFVTNVNWTISPAYAGPGTCAISGAVGSQVLSCAFGTISASQTFTIGLQSPSSSIGTYTDTAIVVIGTQKLLSIGTLSVQGAAAFTGLSPSQTIIAGTASINLSGTIASGTNYPTPGETVSISINGVSQIATIDPSGAFSITFNTGAIPASTLPYTITYTYTGDPNFTPATNTSSTLTVNPNNSSTLLISPSSIDFGQVPIGGVSVKNITLSNLGNSAISILRVAKSRTGTGNYHDYSVVNHCPESLAGGHNCSLRVTYSPDREVPFPDTSSTSVIITDTAAGSPQSVPVRAQNINPKSKLSTNLLIFGKQQVGTTSSVKTVTLTNVGTTPLTLNSISINGDFVLDASTTCQVGLSLTPNQTCSLAAKFSPTKLDIRGGLLTISDNALRKAAFVVLAGKGQ